MIIWIFPSKRVVNMDAVGIYTVDISSQLPHSAAGEPGQVQYWKPWFPHNTPSGAPGALESQMALRNTWG